MKFLKNSSGKDFRDEVLHLTDLAELAGDDGVIEYSRFEHCHLIGPAVLVVQGDSNIIGNEFQGDPDAYLWVIPPERPRVIGAILVKDSAFEQCTFTNIGLAGTPEFVQQFRESVERHAVT